jgi:hypothetical protein
MDLIAGILTRVEQVIWLIEVIAVAIVVKKASSSTEPLACINPSSTHQLY